MIHFRYFDNWPFDQALSWMDYAHKEVRLCRRRFLVAVGTHNQVTITLGRDHKRSALDINKFSHIPNCLIRNLDRGGGITVHEPGQLVMYPVLNLKAWNIQVRELIDMLLTTMLKMSEYLGVNAQVSRDSLGVFVKNEKVGFLGMRIKEGVSSHGIALNVLNDAKIFSYIDPCGVKGLKVSSLCHFQKLDNEVSEYMRMLAWLFESLIKKNML